MDLRIEFIGFGYIRFGATVKLFLSFEDMVDIITQNFSMLVLIEPYTLLFSFLL